MPFYAIEKLSNLTYQDIIIQTEQHKQEERLLEYIKQKSLIQETKFK